jgi:hypothetical protein
MQKGEENSRFSHANTPKNMLMHCNELKNYLLTWGIHNIHWGTRGKGTVDNFPVISRIKNSISIRYSV